MSRDAEREFLYALGAFVNGLADDDDLSEMLTHIGSARFDWEYGVKGNVFGNLSPIERLLLAHLMFVHDGYSLPTLSHRDEVRDEGLFIIPQQQIDRYRVDFLIELRYAGRVKAIVVECDGHDYHERTKEQAAKDKSRDRYLVAKGYPVLRFTGSEIYRSPEQCAAEVANQLEIIAIALVDGGAR
jgi:very-short-patch-repair endonuclease